MKTRLKIRIRRKHLLTSLFFASVFTFASFTKEDRLKVRAFKLELMQKYFYHENDKDQEASLPDKLPIESEKFSGSVSSAKNKNFLGEDLGKGVSTHVEKPTHIFESLEKQGVIGEFSEEGLDTATDNFFTIPIPEIKDQNVIAYLQYDLIGLASYHSVSRSINQNIGFGGDIIVPSNTWSTQKEEISLSSLKQGKNTLLFTTSVSGIKYRVKNVKILFEKNLNQQTGISTLLSGDNLYVKGVDRDFGYQRINDQSVSTSRGEFETLLKLSEEDKKKGFVSVSSSSGTRQYPLSQNVSSFKTLNEESFTPLTINISKDSEYSENYQDATINIEKSSVENVGQIEVLRLRRKDYPSVSGEIKSFTVNSGAYRLNTRSGDFTKKIKFSFPYDEKKLGTRSAKEIKALYFDYSSKKWEVDPTSVVNTETKTVTVESNGSGDYINGIISAPESPQINAFAPTTISGLKSANPVASAQLMSPPSPNHKGDAAMSYPVIIPSGVNGLQPNISISYNSSGGNGWMGEGWDVGGVSTIALDTRWGTPSFSNGYESEIYTLDGEMLLYEGDYLPHRHNNFNASNGTFDTTKQARNASGKKTFYLRKNNNFTKIERYGTSPSTYRWVITSTDGTRSYYGGNENAVIDEAVLKDNNRNIVQWGICKTIDIHDNNIKYKYTNEVYNSFTGADQNLNGGKDFHIKKIFYNGRNDEDGKYEIEFNISNPLVRYDISLNAKLGFKKIEPHVLNNIAVYVGVSDRVLIRKYQFSYGMGEFGKTILSRVETGNQKYDLQYHNGIASSGYALFSEDNNIGAPNTDAFPSVINSVLSPSKISADAASEWGWSIRAGGGLSFLKINTGAVKNFMITGFYGESYQTTKKAQQLIDFNGDGIVDILYRKRNGDEGIKYYPGYLDANGKLAFEWQPKNVLNLNSNFGYTKGETDNSGFTVLLNVFGFGFDFTKSQAKSSSNTPIFLVDANSDGLPDVVKDDKVWFNKTNTASGTQEMVTTSDVTENMVIIGNQPDPPADLPDDETNDPVKAKVDVVKVWVAPKAGYVKVSDNISIEDAPGANAVYSIEALNPNSTSGKNCRLYLHQLQPGSPQGIKITRYNDYPGTPLGVANASGIYVNVGDKIYFRLHRNTPENFIVTTSPVVTYVDGSGSQLPDSEWETQEAYAPNDTGYSKKFLLNNMYHAKNYDTKGNVRINIPAFKVSKLTDKVTFKIVKSKRDVQDPATDIEVIYEKEYLQSASPLTIDQVDIMTDIPDDLGYNIKYYVEAGSHIDLQSVEWKDINQQYITADSQFKTMDVAQYPSYVARDMKKKLNLSNLGVSVPGTQNFSVSINKNLTSSLQGRFIYVIKRGETVLDKRIVEISPSGAGDVKEYTIDSSPISGLLPIPVFSGNIAQPISPSNGINILVYCQTMKDRKAYEQLRTVGAGKVFNIYYGNNTYVTNTSETLVNTGEYDMFSAFYHNWGQFLYDSAKDVKNVSNNSNGSFPNPRETPDILPGDPSVVNNVLNPDTPKDNYGMLINNGIIESDPPSMSVNFSACSGITNPDAYQECLKNSIMANSAQYSNNSTSYYTPLLPMIPFRDLVHDRLTEKWTHVMYTETYSAADSFRDHPNMPSFYVDTDPDQPDYESPSGNINTKMFAIEKRQKSKSRTKNWALGFVAGSNSNSTSELRDDGNINTQDFFDVNGDGYPDMLFYSRFQLTNSIGGLEKTTGNLAGDAFITKNESYLNTRTVAFSPSALKDAGRNFGNSNSDAKADSSTSWSGGIGASTYYNSYDKGVKYWLDINGDGLVDRIYQAPNGSYVYKLNFGDGNMNSAQTAESFGSFVSQSSTPVSSWSVNIGGALSGAINTAGSFTSGFGISAGAGISSSTGSSKTALQDVNGDGMVDLIEIDNGITYVRYNLGNKFLSRTPIRKRTGSSSSVNVDYANENKTHNGSLTLGGGFYINIPLITIFGATLVYIKAGLDATANVGLSLSEVNKSFQDVNGDGFPDLINNTDGGLTVNYSNIGKTNKLYKVTETNSNGSFTIDYSTTAPSFNDPTSRVVMSEVKVLNPDVYAYNYTFTDDTKNMKTRYQYENGKYDRRERDKYGFEKVTTEVYNGNNLERKTIDYYYNANRYINGLLKRTETYKGATTLAAKTENKYRLYKYVNNYSQLEALADGLFETYDTGGTEGKRAALTLLTETINTVYESGGSIITKNQMKYDNKGSMVLYNYISNDASKNYSSAMNYHDYPALTSKNIRNVPQSIKVYNGSGTLMKDRSTEINPNTGDVTVMSVKLNNNETAATSYSYDIYGNVLNINYPNSYELNYTYDSALHKYVTEVKDNFEIASLSEYDNRFDVVVKSTDPSGNSIIYQYDNLGRPVAVLAPKEQGVSDYTIKYSYFDVPVASANANIPIKLYGSLTQHYDAERPNDPIETISFADFLGRNIQTKKDIFYKDEAKMSVSGKIVYDQLGRAVKQYHPMYEEKNMVTNKKFKYENALYYTQSYYDNLDRVISSQDEEGNATQFVYSIEGGNYKTTSTQNQDLVTQLRNETYSSAEGKKIQNIDYLSGQQLRTSFTYNAVGELIGTVDPLDIKTKYNYDLGGRKISERNPDRGETRYTYDTGGYLTKLVTANMNNTGSAIDYKYNVNRLYKITFPQLPNGNLNPNNVTYTYGDHDTGNESGRLVSKKDGSGIYMYKYGNTGEIAEDWFAPKGYNLPNFYFHTQYTYDSWNRIKSISYPDNQFVTYAYDLGGNVGTVAFADGSHQGTQGAAYIKYDEYEQRTEIAYQNDTKSQYTYSPAKRMLSRHMLSHATGMTSEYYLDNKYTYDFVGNVLGISNGAAKASNGLGGGYDFGYRYDQLNRLISSEGGIGRDPKTGQILAGFDASYWSIFSYNKAGGFLNKEQWHQFDGNVVEENTYKNEYNNQDTTHRVESVRDLNTGKKEIFKYDSNGNVTLIDSDYKSPENMYWDEQDRLRAHYKEHSFQYYVYNDKGERTMKMSLIGGTELYQNGVIADVGNFGIDNYKLYPNPYLVVNSDGSYTTHYYIGSQRFASRLRFTFPQSFYDVPANFPQSRVASQSNANAGEDDFKNYLSKAGIDINSLEKGIDERPGPPILFGNVYYLHGDHLGTASMVTDYGGNPSQYFLNLPFGETFAEQVNWFGYTNPYKFNAKELDGETGLYYYGARYYNPRLSIWYGVDPLAEKYPGWSPFAYTMDNPVKYVDPDGRDIVIWYLNDKGHEAKYVYGSKTPIPNNPFVQNAVKTIDKLRETKSFENFVIYDNIKVDGNYLEKVISDPDRSLNVVPLSPNLDKSVFNSTYKQKGYVAGTDLQQFATDGSYGTINFNDEYGIQFSNGDQTYTNSPAAVFGHEFAHLIHSNYNSQSNAIYNKGKGNGTNATEEAATVKDANQINSRLGEKARVNHSGSNFKFNNPTNNKNVK